MAAASPSSPRSLAPAGSPLSAVHLEVRAAGTVASYNVGETGFLLGSVPGCDLRLPGTNQPPVLALIARHPDGVVLRKLAPIGLLLVNAQPVTEATLQDGDQLSIGGVEIGVSITATPTVPVMRVRLYDESSEEREALLREREQALDEERAQTAAERHELATRALELSGQEEEVKRIRQEMAEIRKQLVERYRQKRDRLAKMQASVRRAAHRVQEQKSETELLRQQVGALSSGAYETEIRTLAGQMAEKGHALEEQEQALRQREQRLDHERLRLQSELAARESRLEEERQALARSQTQHQTDLVRLDRLAATLEQRQRQMQRTALEVDRRYEALQRDTREMEEQAGQIDECHAQMREQNAELVEQKRMLDAARAELTARAAALEGQQAMLASLKTRLERMREEYRKHEQQLDVRQSRQDEAEVEIDQRLTEARQLSQQLEAEKQLREQQQKQFEERRATLEAAVSQLRLAQEQLAGEVQELDGHRLELRGLAERQREQEALLEARTQEAEATQQRLRAERQGLDERLTNLARAEQVMAALQEQLRKRAEELTARQQALDERAQRDQETREAVEARQAELETLHQQREEEHIGWRGELDRQLAELADARLDLEQREEALRGEVRELIETKEQLASVRQQFEADQAGATREAEQARQETEAARTEAAALEQQMSQWQRQVEESLSRLAVARDQLREHLAEIHAYIKQGRSDLESLRDGVIGEQQRLREQEQALHQARDGHRLAVATFRQQLSEWQGQLAELKLSQAQGETRLEQRLAEVEQQAQQIAVTSQQLAQQAEELEKQERQVVERRQEVDRHLSDMREWYRRKIRELARVETDTELPETPGADAPGSPAPAGSPEDTTTLAEVRPGLLNLTGDVEPGDRQLGELMRSLELIDADTLTALLVEARRKRRSLRQLLLQGGYLTLFQLALIETGNLDGLVLGPVRVIDRLHATAHEAAYRVFDPRQEHEALLRHLAESEMQDAVRPDEFRQRFAAAVEVRHPNLMATYETLEIADRPAVLQEWLTGLPSSDWPALATVPGVWYRLLSQAAQGLQAAHQAGLTHGQLRPAQVIFTPEGVLKVCGLGEPAWLSGAEESAGDIADDLRALGRCALAWSTPGTEKKSARAKPLPDSLQALLRRLCGEEGTPFADTKELLDELDAVGRTIPANAAAWERFVRHVRDQASETPLRRSA